jgi:hypothetical protein
MSRELTPWEKFVAATRQIVAVPKKDVDKAMKEWKERRKKDRRGS